MLRNSVAMRSSAGLEIAWLTGHLDNIEPGSPSVNRADYYRELKALALRVRAENGLTTPRVLRSDLRRLYRIYGIHRVDLWPPRGSKEASGSLWGAYFNDEDGISVMLARHLPDEPMIFTMAHELKHHLVDQALPASYCSPSNQQEPIEIGAGVFASELIFPDGDFTDALTKMGIDRGACTPEAIVHLKRGTETTLSYAALAKKAEFLRFATSGSLDKVKWKKLEEQLYGEPAYKRIQRYRQRRAMRTQAVGRPAGA